MSNHLENNVGILAMEVYFPSSFVTQKDLEVEYKVSAGKFTKGLGQDTLAFVGDREDINSICLTVVNNLLEKYEIPREKVGRLEVGTETLVDKSKSTKTVLMSLFEGVGNLDVEGTTTVNACYGGTAALINALNWVDSASYDGRYAIVVAGDIAVYAEGPARPTSGCGAVAMLIGRDAPLTVDLLTRSSYACNQWDFFKPDPHTEYPVVNGKYSQSCYLMAFDSCYSKFVERQKTRRNRDVGSKTADHLLFHSPYNKLVQKTVQRMYYLDSLSGHIDMDPQLTKWKNIPTDKTYTDRELEGVLKNLAQPLYESKVAPCCVLSKEVGNTYTAAVYMNLANMVSSFGKSLEGQSVTLFSYGSGTMASMFEIRPRQPSRGYDSSVAETFSLERMQAVLGIEERLSLRKNPSTPAQFTKALNTREKAHACAPYTPTYPPTVVSKGTFYLEEISASHERTYARRPLLDPTPDFVDTFDPVVEAAIAAEKEVREDPRSNNTGIVAIDVYFPASHVRQKDLEVEYKVSAGKFTKGLGQDTLAFVGDREDINSICLTVVNNLLEKYEIPREKVGRLEVGTETLVDKSKSTKTVLMSLFEGVGNLDVEGTTTVNACYGGTAALINALNWVDSPAWDGRYAIVVAGDIAVYAEGPARPTSGCGAVAMLIGRDAPLTVDLLTRSSYACNQWDFFKPDPHTEYPVVNGKYSQSCYLMAFDSCYSKFVERQKTRRNRDVGSKTADHLLFHSPYNKLVQKTVQRMYYLDSLSGHIDMDPQLTKWKNIPTDKTYTDRELEGVLKNLAQPLYESKVAPCCVLSKEVGNTYTAAVYMNLANMVSSFGKSLEGQSVTLFSYGSGTMASMFEIRPRQPSRGYDSSVAETFSLERMQAVLGIEERLSLRKNPSTPAQFTKALYTREKAHACAPYTPTYPPTVVSKGSYFLVGVSENHERTYSRRPVFDPTPDFVDTDEEHFATATRTKEVGLHASIPRNKSFVWASGKPLLRVVVTGVAAALPGGEDSVFTSGVNNIHRIIAGDNFITPVPDKVKADMLEKNVVIVRKNPDGVSEKVKINCIEDNIQLSANIVDSNLSSYGVPPSIVNTMDVAVQVAVAAGLEALRDAGIVNGDGDGVKGWVLPEHLQKTTGIVYATSFPALDTAISEVTSFFRSKIVENEDIQRVIEVLRMRFRAFTGSSTLSVETEKAFEELEKEAAALRSGEESNDKYAFDRKFLFRVLVLGNAQLAQIIQAQGPNMQTNAACAGSTQAVALAHDMIQLGRAERMIVIAGDNASSDTLMPWIGNGFRALGAATISDNLQEAAQPFCKGRSGMILGSGGIGMVLESEEGARRRFVNALKNNDLTLSSRTAFKCRILGTLYSNSAYHGAALNRTHIAEEMERFITTIEREQGITRSEIARFGTYFSHETSTNSSPTSSCASNEIYGLRKVFGHDFKNLVILNTKGFTGHPMGVSFEDVVAVEVLRTGVIPPIANLTEVDPYLGSDLNLSRGGSYPCKYAIRFAAGFGSQIAMAMYGSVDT